MQYILSETEYAALNSRIAELESVNHNLATSLLEAGRDMDGMSKALAEAKSHEESLRKAWTEALDGKNRLFDEANNLRDQLAYFLNLAGDRYDRLQKVEEERNALQESLAKAQRRIEHSEHLSERRLRLANALQTEVQRLKHESVAIVLSPSKRYRAVSLGKVGTYERFGWVVLDEGYAVDRPA